LEERLEKELSEDARREVLLEAMVEGADELARAVSNLDSVINGDSGSQVPHAMERLRVLSGVAADLARRNYASAVVVVLQEWEAAGGAGSLPASVRRYVPFVVELASAQSSNEVAATFDAYAAPLGTYELKYKRSMVALNGFVGGHAGWERLGSEGVTATNTIIGGFAPVGVHGSFPVSDHLHLGFVLSVLDLGAVTTAKVDNEEPEGDLEGADPQTEPQASKAAEIGFEQVFSPGAYAVVGLGGSPFVAGFGVSMTPELREVRQDGLRTAVSVLRYGAFLAVDIPIVPLD
jgi:hypothetical protein